MTVRFYFDFLSPYSYLASALIAREPRYRSIDFDPRPVVFGTILSRLGARGAGEIPARRRIGLQDAMMMAALHGVPFEGPPAHPFNSVWALRSVAAIEDRALRLSLAARYFHAAWGEGRRLDDPTVLAACLAELGIEQDPEQAGTAPAQRTLVKRWTEELLEAGGWGVPTFIQDEILFFGHDRLPLLAAYLAGEVRSDSARLEAMLARPQGMRVAG